MLEGARDALRRQKTAQAEQRLQAGKAWRDEGWVFATHTGGGLAEHNVDRAFRRIRERADLLAAIAAQVRAGAGDGAIIRALLSRPAVARRHAEAPSWLAGEIAAVHARAAAGALPATDLVRPLPLYSLRHATASILVVAGVPVAVPAKMMGHSVAPFADASPPPAARRRRQADAFLAERRAASVPSPTDGRLAAARLRRTRQRVAR